MSEGKRLTIFSPPVAPLKAAPVPKAYPYPWSGQVVSPRKVPIPSKVSGPGGKTWVGAVDNEEVVAFPVFFCSRCKVMRCLKEKSIENQVMEKMTDQDNTIIDFCPVCKEKTIHTKFGR